MTPDKYQQAVIHDAANGSGHALVRARAGRATGEGKEEGEIMQEFIMVIKGSPKQIQTDIGVIYFREDISTLFNDGYPQILARLIDGKRVRRAYRENGRIVGSAVHSISKENEEVVREAYPGAEWHYMKVEAYPIHIFVALDRGSPVAIAAPVTSRSEDFTRKDKWVKALETRV